jgi:hypothetical protein
MCRVQLKCDGTRGRTGGEVKGKLANGVGSQYSSRYLGTWCIQHYYRLCAQLGCQLSTELTPTPRRFKWTRPFRRKTKSGFCACAIAVTFQTQSYHRGRRAGTAIFSTQCLVQFLNTYYFPLYSISNGNRDFREGKAAGL